jgi:HK97 gp10 family phage protein
MTVRATLSFKLIGGKELHDKLHKMGESVVHANARAAREAELPILREANLLAPGPHILALTSVIESTEDLSVVNIGPDPEHWYYCFTETGTSAHEIFGQLSRPKGWVGNKRGKPSKTGKKMLRFISRGTFVTVKKVNHPGMPARPFLRPAMQHNTELAYKIAGEVFMREINKVIK